MRGRGLESLVVALVVAFVAIPVASAADRKPPRIVGAQMLDADRDGKADRVKLTYTERIRHALDKKGFPFTVVGYKVKRVNKASGKTLVILLAEQAAADPTAAPAVRYKRTTQQPVRDRAGNQAAKQTFKGTLPFGVPPAQGPQPQPPAPVPIDTDGDGYIAGDCAPTNASVHPGADDFPEPSYVDSNCDGIDGDKAKALFVSGTGTDDPACGDFGDPCATLQKGLTEAPARAKRDIYLAAGTYVGPFVLASGVNVFGGFDTGWERNPANTVLDRVARLTATAKDATTNQWMTVRAAGISQALTLADVRIDGPNVVGVGEAGKSSYAIYVANTSAMLTILRADIHGGNGAAGIVGANGANAIPQTAASAGGPGGNGVEQTDCDGTSHGSGGPRGTNGLVPGGVADGGNGGNGGEMDTSCPFNLDATSGDNGANAAVSGPTFGLGGSGGPANASGCGSGFGTPGGPGSPGRVVNGRAGTGGTGSTVTGGFWTANAGNAGGLGEHGTGGGGGGGGGGCDDGTDAWGTGGGGGGAGGVRAPSAGASGGGGGGTFGVFVVSAGATVTGSTIRNGLAGNGGPGGAGGTGQPGGAGGPGGAHPGASPAGQGGAGSHGGHSGGGGGGVGGAIYLLYASNGLITAADNITFLSLGSGMGGPGGPHLAPDGSAGSPGATGPSGVCVGCA